MTPFVRSCEFCKTGNVGEGTEGIEMTVCPICGAFLPEFRPEYRQHWPINSLFSEKGYLLMTSLRSGPVYNYYDAIPRNGSECEKVVVKEFFPANAGYYREPGSDTVKKRDGFAQEEKLYRAALENEVAQLPSDFIPHEIRHPHMENIIDVFDLNNTTYLVINRIDGCPLKQHTLERVYTRRGYKYFRHRQPLEVLLPILLPLCRELASYHERGAVHNNIKPETLLTGSSLGDWESKPICLQKETPGADDFDPLESTQNGLPLQPTPWRPIEIYLNAEKGPWTDIYSLCASLYYCITGREPPLALNQRGNHLVRLSGLLGAALPQHQKQVLLKGLTVQPSDRWQSMNDFCEALYGSQWRG